jgi:hypothetical protein
MTTLDRWTAEVCAGLDLDPARLDLRQILDLARDVAHQVERPAAPVTAYLLGLAVGAGQPADQAVARILALAEQWTRPDQPDQ